MATYRVTDPTTGRKLKLTGDSPPTEEELNQIFNNLGPLKQKPGMTQEGFAKNIMSDVGQNLAGQAELGAYAFPPLAAMKGASGQNIYDPQRLKTLGKGIAQGVAETPKRLLQSISSPIKSTYERPLSTALDLATLASLGSAAATSAPVRATGRGIARAAESISGLEYNNPGILKKAAENPKILFRPGKEAGGKFYEAAKKPEANIFEGISSNKEIFDKANEIIKQGGKLEPSEALTARKATDALISKNDSVKDVLLPLRSKLDKIAKSDKRIAVGDKITREGIESSELRRFFPVNKSGGTSIMKSTLGTLAGLGPAVAMSPLVQGAVATGVGAVGRTLAPAAAALPTLAALQAEKALVEEIKVKPLTKKIAKKYLKDALKETGGDLDQARILADEKAKKDGYDTTVIK